MMFVLLLSYWLLCICSTTSHVSCWATGQGFKMFKVVFTNIYSIYRWKAHLSSQRTRLCNKGNTWQRPSLDAAVRFSPALATVSSTVPGPFVELNLPPDNSGMIQPRKRQKDQVTSGGSKLRKLLPSIQRKDESIDNSAMHIRYTNRGSTVVVRKKHNMCKKCGLRLGTKTRHIYVNRRVFCIDKEGLSFEEWKRKLRL